MDIYRRNVTSERLDARETTDEHATAVRLGLAIQRIRARIRAEAPEATGWTISQLSTLSRIIDRGPVTASALAASEHVRPQSIAEIVNALKAEGLVSAEPDPADGRKVLLVATDAGRTVIRTVSASRAAWLDQAVEAVIEAAEIPVLEQAIELLDRLAECDLRDSDRGGWRA